MDEEAWLGGKDTSCRRLGSHMVTSKYIRQILEAATSCARNSVAERSGTKADVIPSIVIARLIDVDDSGNLFEYG